jgi:hypothetical protein
MVNQSNCQELNEKEIDKGPGIRYLNRLARGLVDQARWNCGKLFSRRINHRVLCLGLGVETVPMKPLEESVRK